MRYYLWKTNKNPVLSKCNERHAHRQHSPRLVCTRFYWMRVVSTIGENTSLPLASSFRDWRAIHFHLFQASSFFLLLLGFFQHMDLWSCSRNYNLARGLNPGLSINLNWNWLQECYTEIWALGYADSWSKTTLDLPHVNDASHTNHFQQAVIDARFLEAVVTLRPPEVGSRAPAVWRAQWPPVDLWSAPGCAPGCPAKGGWFLRLQKLHILLPHQL